LDGHPSSGFTATVKSTKNWKTYEAFFKNEWLPLIKEMKKEMNVRMWTTFPSFPPNESITSFVEPEIAHKKGIYKLDADISAELSLRRRCYPPCSEIQSKAIVMPPCGWAHSLIF
jgi:hypothetical protein